MERVFKGVWIPRSIWLSKDLTLTEKVFLTEIDSLDNTDGCFATNEYFATFFSLSKNRCSEIIKSLKEKGYIDIKYIYKENSKEIQKRILKVKKNVYFEEELSSESRLTPSNYRLTPSENCEDNNTINNTINKNIYSEILKYLNFKSGKQYELIDLETETIDRINSLLQRGYTKEDFFKVIDIKVAEWIDTDFRKYLRPETLFGVKFGSYLKQEVNKSKGNYTSNNSKRHKENTSSSYNHNDIESEILKFQEGL